jgi:nitrogen PTS system EIIA component
MVELEQLLCESRIACQEALPTKKRVLERVSELLTLDLSDINPQELFEALVAREKLGSTSIGHGVALPHVRHPAVIEPRAAFIQLTTPVEFDTIQNTEVDLIFALLVPGEAHTEHLLILAQCARLFQQGTARQLLRRAHNSKAVLDALVKSYEY